MHTLAINIIKANIENEYKKASSLTVTEFHKDNVADFVSLKRRLFNVRELTLSLTTLLVDDQRTLINNVTERGEN